MSAAVPDILTRILDTKREEVHQLRSPRRSFRNALLAQKPAIIAEIKKASPSKGIFTSSFDPASIARSYESGGASALSILTDQQYFQGSLNDLRTARAATSLPVIRKDFIIDESQIAEAFSAEADAILLIAAAMDTHRLRNLREFAESLGLDVLVESHNEEELRSTIDSGATIIGINNRNLHTFEVTLETSIRLAEMIPADAVKVSESGIHRHADIEKLMEFGYTVFLVGERLMTTPDPAQSLRELIG